MGRFFLNPWAHQVPEEWPVDDVAQEGAYDRGNVELHALGREVGAGPQAEEFNVRITGIAKDMTAEVGADLVAEERLERRRSMRGDRRLVHAVVGRAEQADIAARPGLLARPGDAGKMVLHLGFGVPAP